ncbi:hypothetical protein [Williamsia phyllosphaerae]|uniref:Uncharacterized protein n=1 Tax=Williamsia phyllosphaerae TaxID=885042 RepID=A0ABQ1UQQ1_9NOCA|nr:hypothetical protein [Williamsia phyllosphaerae]GGF22993.1 hypothetical protein GCM10007298_18660 [Williamsia phyllosphaerae]
MADTRSRALIAVGVVTAVVVALGITVLLVSRDNGSTVDVPTGDPPSARGATYSLDFGRTGASTTVAPGLREFRIGDLSAPARVVDGALSQGTTETAGATYFEREGRTPYSGIGVTASPPDGPGDSAAVLILADNTIPQDARVSPRPNVLAHLVIQADGWELGVWEQASPTLQVVAAGRFPVSPGAPASYELEWTGRTVRVHQPDGTVKNVTDDRFAVGVPRFATWELFQEGPGAESTRIRAWWAR